MLPFDRSLGSLEVSWSLLGRSWRPVCAFLDALEGVLGALGRLLGRLRGDQNITKMQDQKNTNLRSGGVIVTFGRRFWLPKSTKIEPKTSQHLRRFSRANKNRLPEPLGAVLGRSWSIWGAILGYEKAFSYWKNQYGNIIDIFDVDQLARHVLDRSWRILAAKSAKHDPKKAPQTDPKSTKNRCQKNIKI